MPDQNATPEPSTPIPGSPPTPDERATGDLLRRTAELAIAWRSGLDGRRVGADPSLTPEALRSSLGGPLPQHGTDAWGVVSELARDAEPGLIAMSGPRYFGFVIGGSVPAALAADWLTSAWDQNAGLYLATPSAAMVEEVAGAWLVELLGLPAGTSVGFVTGATMASTTCLAAARGAVLRAAGWDVEEDGLVGAPPVRVLVGGDVHLSVLMALWYLPGRAAPSACRPTPRAGCIPTPSPPSRATMGRSSCAHRRAKASTPGRSDPLARDRAGRDGTMARGSMSTARSGLWAAASLRAAAPGRRPRGADLWATDGHKWLNVPYDSGFAPVRDAAAHRAAMQQAAPHTCPRARAPPATPGTTYWSCPGAPGVHRVRRDQELGATGIAALVERDHDPRDAWRTASDPSGRDHHRQRCGAQPGVAGVREDDDLTRDAIARIQREGTTWLGATTFKGRARMRVSVSGWHTTAADIDRSADAILRCVDEALAGRG
ncbi:MAG: aspartate aminotransferase family protein [Chloroflexota bacterium]